MYSDFDLVWQDLIQHPRCGKWIYKRWRVGAMKGWKVEKILKNFL